jgi:hypothetical protein
MTSRFLGRDPATVAADLAAIRDALGDGIDEAQAAWAELDALSRNNAASSYTRRRAHAAAVALGSLLDDLAAEIDPEQPFTWNDPPEAEQ